jgi:hypothetical protein
MGGVDNKLLNQSKLSFDHSMFVAVVVFGDTVTDTCSPDFARSGAEEYQVNLLQ